MRQNCFSPFKIKHSEFNFLKSFLKKTNPKKWQRKNVKKNKTPEKMKRRKEKMTHKRSNNSINILGIDNQPVIKGAVTMQALSSRGNET